jgi:hypothetical protein
MAARSGAQPNRSAGATGSTGSPRSTGPATRAAVV